MIQRGPRDWLLVVAVIGILSYLLSALERAARKAEASMDENNFVVRQPKLTLWVGVICALTFSLFMILMTVYPNDSAEWWVYLCFFVFAILGIGLVVYYVRWRIIVSGDTIRFVPFVGGGREIPLDSLTRVVQKPRAFTVYAGDHVAFTLEANCVGYGRLSDRLAREGVPFVD